jgi:hypothetical protein
MKLDTRLPIKILQQPDDTTCGPTCLHAVYRYYGEDVTLRQVIEQTPMLDTGGTLAVLLANHALARGYRADIYTYNLQMFDPSWFTSRINLAKKLRLQAEAKREDTRLQQATAGYLEFLRLGGKVRFTDLNARLIRGIIRRNLPILTGLSATYLYRSMREFGPDDEYNDIQGYASGHFVVLAGYHRQDRTVLVADPHLHNPEAHGHMYAVRMDRLICAILLGVLTYDANLLVIQKDK